MHTLWTSYNLNPKIAPFDSYQSVPYPYYDCTIYFDRTRTQIIAYTLYNRDYSRPSHYPHTIHDEPFTLPNTPPNITKILKDAHRQILIHQI